MRPSLVQMLFLLFALLLLLAAHRGKLLEWWDSLSFTRQYWYGMAATMLLCLIVSRFDLVQAGILLAGTMWINFLCFLLWFIFQIDCA